MVVQRWQQDIMNSLQMQGTVVFLFIVIVEKENQKWL
jgi:hypothetical protein